MKNTVKNEVPYSQYIITFEKGKLIHYWGSQLQLQAPLFSLDTPNLLGKGNVR